MKRATRRRRLVGVGFLVLAGLVVAVMYAPSDLPSQAAPPAATASGHVPAGTVDVRTLLDSLAVKGRAPNTSYARSQFGNGWSSVGGCDMRNIILKRDLRDTSEADCKVTAGMLDDPYTGKVIEFRRGSNTSSLIQIDHVVALNDAWQKGAQQWTIEKRTEFANDPLELLAVDGEANQQKSNGDAATWLPPNKAFRCQYVARQVAVKHKYGLWVTVAEKVAIQRVLESCPGQATPDRVWLEKASRVAYSG